MVVRKMLNNLHDISLMMIKTYTGEQSGEIDPAQPLNKGHALESSLLTSTLL